MLRAFTSEKITASLWASAYSAHWSRGHIGITMQTGMAFSLPAAVKGVEDSEICRLVDVHMTETT